MTLTKIQSPKIIKYYNHSAKIIDFSNLTSSYKEWLKSEEKFLRKIIPEKARILEIGAGNGRIIDVINNGKREVIGIEIANLPFLKKRYKSDKNVQILKMDAHKLLFKENLFDVCLIMYNTLGLMHDPLDVLKECKRITRKGGKIIVSTYSMDTEYVLKERIACFTKIGHKVVKIHGMDFEIENGVTSHYFLKDELKNLFNGVNLKPSYHPISKLGCIWIAKT